MYGFLSQLAATEVVRQVMRFARKYYAAQFLSARLFQPEREAQEVKEEIWQSQLYKSGDKKLLEVLALPVNQLQQWVRQSWLNEGHGSVEGKRFSATVVKPSLSVNPGAIPNRWFQSLDASWLC